MVRGGLAGGSYVGDDERRQTSGEISAGDEGLCHERPVGTYECDRTTNRTYLEKRMSKTSPTPLLTTRSAVVLLLGAACGAVTGVLVYLTAPSVAAAVLGGVTASGAAVAFFHANIGHDKSESR